MDKHLDKTVVVGLKCSGEARQFSAWKALVAVTIGYGVVIVPLVTIIGTFTFFAVLG